MRDEGWDERLHRADAGAIYLHVPFCARKCAYCDFASWATPGDDPAMPRYRDALMRQLGEASELGLVGNAATAYVGGGTPTLLGAGLGRLAARVRAVAPCVEELSCEANPDSLSDEVLACAAEAGVTRLSIGVQSLADEELVQLGRIHDAACARERVSEAVSAGFDVSVDLMCATPLQTRESWRETLLGALGLGVGHVSVYPLAIEEGTALARRVGDDDPAWNDTAVQAERMTDAERLLEDAGLMRYEVASYARTGHACRHNVAYWTGVPYLGLGTGAASMLAREGYERLRGVCEALPAAPDDAVRARLVCTTGRAELAGLADAAFDVEFLTLREAVAEDLMLGARLVSGLDPVLVVFARGIVGDALDDTLWGCLLDGLLVERDGRMAPTRKGWLLGNDLFGRLWDLAGR